MESFPLTERRRLPVYFPSNYAAVLYFFGDTAIYYLLKVVNFFIPPCSEKSHQIIKIFLALQS